MICYHFCKKCGRIAFGDEDLKELCDVCGEVMFPVPEKYIKKGEILTDKEIKERGVPLMEELVKTSPEFDQYLFDHRDEILAEKNAKYEQVMAHGRAILEEQSKRVKCTYCGSSNIRKIGLLNRAISTELWGLGSKKIGKQFHCNNCGADF